MKKVSSDDVRKIGRVFFRVISAAQKVLWVLDKLGLLSLLS